MTIYSLNKYIYLYLLLGCLFTGCVTLPAGRNHKSIPLSQVASGLSMSIYWDAVHGCAHLEKGDKFMLVYPDEQNIILDGQKISMPTSAHREGGELHISASFYNLRLVPYFSAPPEETSEEPAPLVRPRKTKKYYHFHVLLDPGHGGKDPGATGIEGVREKDLNLDICKRLARYLKYRKVQVTLTRDEDKYISLDERVQFTEAADCFISIHFNSAGTPRSFRI